MRIATLIMCAAIGLSSVAVAQEEPDPRVLAAGAAMKANELASKGKLADAVPYYEKAMRLDAVNHELAYYNLAEVQKARGNCPAAVLTYQLYASLVGTAEARKEADEGIKTCVKQGWPTLKLTAKAPRGEVYINGFLAAPGGTFGPLVVPPGSYDVRYEAADHHPATSVVEVRDKAIEQSETLKKMTFFGTISVTVDVPGAKVRIFEGTTDETPELHSGTGAVKDVKAREGRHFVEVTADGYNRWIRNVSVGRDVDTEVSVELTRSVPPEIR